MVISLVVPPPVAGSMVYAGLPIAIALPAQGRSVTLANLSFADIAAPPQSAWVSREIKRCRAGVQSPAAMRSTHLRDSGPARGNTASPTTRRRAERSLTRVVCGWRSCACGLSGPARAQLN